MMTSNGVEGASSPFSGGLLGGVVVTCKPIIATTIQGTLNQDMTRGFEDHFLSHERLL